jgi:hypothetical protein
MSIFQSKESAQNAAEQFTYDPRVAKVLPQNNQHLNYTIMNFLVKNIILVVYERNF